MKNLLIFLLLIASYVGVAQPQWSPNGDNTTSGRVVITGTTSSTEYDDIFIARDKANAGIKVLNANASGRAIILFGKGDGSKYGFLAYHSPSFVSSFGSTGTYRPSSTVLTGADDNGLGLVSKSDIRFNAGGDQDAQQRMVIKSDGNVFIGATDGDGRLTISNTEPGISISMKATDSYAYLKMGLAQEYAWIQSYNKRPLRINDIGNDVIFNIGGGHVGIGTTSPDAPLTVKGAIHTNEVRVDVNPPLQGPDYVFEKNYNLLPLSELESYINENKHLPEVPSAKEMEKDGLNLKEMNLILLKKVEELTLHLIEANKKAEIQQQEIRELQKAIPKK